MKQGGRAGGGREAQAQHGLLWAAEESGLHSEAWEAGGEARMSFFSNVYSVIDIRSLFLIF